jgi:hypothetical protein
MPQQVAAYDRLRDDLLQAPHRGTTPLLNYGPDENRVPPRPDLVSQPKRMTAAPGSAPVMPVASPVPAPAPSLQHNRAEYGHFNEARLLAVTAHAGNDDDQPSGTNAHVRPPKRKGPDSTVMHAAASKKKKSVASETQVATGTALRLDSNMRAATEPDGSSKPAYSCIRCISTGLTNCNGKGHCNNCTAKCKYVLCKLGNCTNETCAKIHPWQYNLQARKSGEQRMMVVYDNQTEKSLTPAEKIHLRGALARMQALQTGSTTNTVESMLQLCPAPAPAPVPGDTAPAINNGMWQTRFTQLLGGKGTQLEKERVGPQPQSKVLPTGASVFSTNSCKPHDAQFTFSTGAPMFSSSTWQESGAQAKGKGVDRGEPGTLALTRTKPSPFDIPQAVRNAALKAQMSAASDAIGLRMEAISKDGFCGDPHIKTENRDDGEME